MCDVHGILKWYGEISLAGNVQESPSQRNTAGREDMTTTRTPNEAAKQLHADIPLSFGEVVGIWLAKCE